MFVLLAISIVNEYLSSLVNMRVYICAVCIAIDHTN